MSSRAIPNGCRGVLCTALSAIVMCAGSGVATSVDEGAEPLTHVFRVSGYRGGAPIAPTSPWWDVETPEREATGTKDRSVGLWFDAVFWGNDRRHFAAVISNLVAGAGGVEEPPAASDRGGIPQFSRTSIFAGSTDGFSWHGAGSNIVHVRSASEGDAAHRAGVDAYREIFDLCIDAIQTFDVRAVRGRPGRTDIVQTWSDHGQPEVRTFTPTESDSATVALIRSPREGESLEIRLVRRDSQGTRAFLTAICATPVLPKDSAALVLPKSPEDLADVYFMADRAESILFVNPAQERKLRDSGVLGQIVSISSAYIDEHPALRLAIGAAIALALYAWLSRVYVKAYKKEISE